MISRNPLILRPQHWVCLAACLLFSGLAVASGPGRPAVGRNQAPNPVQTINPAEWVRAAVDHQQEIIRGDGQFVRYRMQRRDDRGSSLKDVVETRQGFISRTIERNGSPLNGEQQQAEAQRLQSMLSSPDDMARHHRREQADLNRTLIMVQQMPTAMIWSVAPGLSNADTVVLDFKANPVYHPPTRETAILKCLAGRLWIDAQTQRMIRIEGRLVQNVDYGWGFFARLNSGGTVTLEQHPVEIPGGRPHWETFHFEMNVSGLALMVKHLSFNVVEDLSHFEPVPGSPDYSDGIRMLLK